MSLIVTLHVPLYASITQLHPPVCIHAPLSVLFANVAVTFHVVQLFNDGLYVHVPHVGAFVSYVYVTVHCTVLHSSSANVTVHVASHSPLVGGVTLIPLLLHVALHAVQLIFHVLLIVLAPHAPSLAHILVIKSLYNTFVPLTTVAYVNVGVSNVGAVLLIVNVALAILVFHCLSLTVTYCVLLHAFGTCNAVTFNVAPHQLPFP